MPKEIRTEIEIRASPERVWSVLTGFDSYPEWHPSMTITGRPSPGEKLRVRVDAPGLPAMTLQPRVLRSEPAREFAWLGSLGVRGIFDGEHIFELESIGPDRTRLVQRELFTGVLASAVHARIGDSTRAAFEAANEALRVRTEQEPRQTDG
jgi:hypothetical protein